MRGHIQEKQEQQRSILYSQDEEQAWWQDGSAVRCREEGLEEEQHSCLLHNVCLDLSRGINMPHSLRMNFFTTHDEHEQAAAGSFLRKKMYFPSSPTRNTWVSEKAVNGKIPYVVLIRRNISDMTEGRLRHHRKVLFMNDPVVLVDVMDPINAGNYGHAYMDYIFSIFVGASKMAHKISDFAFFPILMRSGNYGDDYLRNFEKYLTLVNASLMSKLSAYDRNSTLCFSKLLLPGYHGLYRDNTATFSEHISSLRDFIYNVHRTDESISTSPIIISFKKKRKPNKKVFSFSGRTLLNKDEVNSSLLQYFGSENLAMYDFGDLTIHQQVTVLRHTKVFVSPLGGASFASLLLPDDAVFLEVDTYNFVSMKSECLIVYECKLYDSLSHIRVMRHSISHQEMTNILSNSTFKPPNRALYMKLMGHYRLNASSLNVSINQALNWYEETNTLRNRNKTIIFTFPYHSVLPHHNSYHTTHPLDETLHISSFFCLVIFAILLLFKTRFLLTLNLQNEKSCLK